MSQKMQILLTERLKLDLKVFKYRIEYRKEPRSLFIKNIKVNNFGKLKDKDIELKKRNKCNLWRK